MRERPSAEQIGAIEDLAKRLRLDDRVLFPRVRDIVGHPVAVLSQLTPAEADTVIAALTADYGRLLIEGATTRHSPLTYHACNSEGCREC